MQDLGPHPCSGRSARSRLTLAPAQDADVVAGLQQLADADDQRRPHQRRKLVGPGQHGADQRQADDHAPEDDEVAEGERRLARGWRVEGGWAPRPRPRWRCADRSSWAPTSRRDRVDLYDNCSAPGPPRRNLGRASSPEANSGRASLTHSVTDLARAVELFLTLADASAP
jgi:hypothetical protein